MLVTQQAVLRRFWYALFPMSAIEAGPKAFTLLGENIVVWKTANGAPAALRDRCCHRTAKLSKGKVVDGDIVCGYHGWTYDGTGRCVRIPQFTAGEQIPSGAKVPAFHCQEKYGYVWVALGEPLKPIPHFPEDGQPGYRRIFQLYQEWQTSPVRMMENSFDNAHFSFVHGGTFGDPASPTPKGYDLIETDFGFEGQTSVPILNPPEAQRVTGSIAPTVTRHLLNRYYLPFSRRFGCSYDSGIDHIIYNCATPIDDGRMVLVQWLYRNDSEAQCSAQELIDWDGAVTAEDREILEATDPDACIDTQRRQEFHMPSDKPGLLIRKLLMALLTEHGETEQHRPALAAP
jgi:phenylpropionate dioxygenase-like ring-hydroxylating dioxygenase large terminal subunit